MFVERHQVRSTGYHCPPEWLVQADVLIQHSELEESSGDPQSWLCVGTYQDKELVWVRHDVWPAIAVTVVDNL